MTPFAHAFAYAIKKTPYAFFAKITLCMYILCGITFYQTGYIVMLRARMFRSLIPVLMIKERNIRARNITI